MDIHTHPACLTLAQLTAGQSVVVTLLAGAGDAAYHTHTATLSMTDVVTLRDTPNPVTVTSSVTGHTHQVTFT
jgi:hypothetical protein